jgi:signal transduction histidine kinase
MKDAWIIMKITDNGQGFEPDAAEGGAGMGLTNMRQRIEALNGNLEYNSVAGQGSKIIARIPVDV